MAGVRHTRLPKGLSVSDTVQDASPYGIARTDPYLRTFVIPLPLVASASAQAIAYTSIKGWPTRLARVVSSGVNVITPEATGTTKNVSLGYAGATTAFVNAQSAAATGAIPGAGVVANLYATNLSYTLSANNWADAVLEGWITVECID